MGNESLEARPQIVRYPGQKFGPEEIAAINAHGLSDAEKDILYIEYREREFAPDEIERIKAAKAAGVKTRLIARGPDTTVEHLNRLFKRWKKARHLN